MGAEAVEQFPQVIVIPIPMPQFSRLLPCDRLQSSLIHLHA